MDNFKTPYLARSIMDFWNRWHISLSSWFREYLFTPLSISFRYWKIFGIVLAVLITFSISGLWHGASWLFILWGGMHGIILLLERGFNMLFHIKPRNKWNLINVFNVFKTFILVSFIWIYFEVRILQKSN